jgi:hypothetical protein
MIVYPNRMSFDIMPGGGKPPEPVGMLVIKVKKVTDIHGGGDLFSKVTHLVPSPASAMLPRQHAAFVDITI